MLRCSDFWADSIPWFIKIAHSVAKIRRGRSIVVPRVLRPASPFARPFPAILTFDPYQSSQASPTKKTRLTYPRIRLSGPPLGYTYPYRGSPRAANFDLRRYRRVL